MYSPIPFTLIPDVNPNISFPWAIFTLVINNQSNCWLTYKGNVIADPGQQSVWVFPASDANPDLELTSATALQTEANPLGSCQIQALYERLDPNPGVMGYAGRSGISVIQNLKLLATLIADVSTPIVVETVSIDPSAQTIIAICQANAGAANGVIDITFNGIGLLNQAITPLQVVYAAAFPVIDNQVTLEVDYAGPGVFGHQCHVIFLSSPAPVLQVANGVLLPMQIDAKDGNAFVVAVGAAYDLAASGRGVLATDRPIDTWTQTAIGGTSVPTVLATQPAPGAGKQLVCTTISWSLVKNASPGVYNALTVDLTDGAGNRKYVARAGLVTQGSSTGRDLGGLHLPAADNQAFVFSLAGISEDTQYAVTISGYTITNPS